MREEKEMKQNKFIQLVHPIDILNLILKTDYQKVEIDATMAAQMEQVTNIHKDVWIRLQYTYDMAKEGHNK